MMLFLALNILAPQFIAMAHTAELPASNRKTNHPSTQQRNNELTNYPNANAHGLVMVHNQTSVI